MSGHHDLLERLRVINPVPGPEHVDRDDLHAVLSVIEERRGVVSTTRTPVPRKVLPARRRRLRPVLAFAAGLAIVLASVGLVATVLSGGDESEVVTETTLPPPQTTTAPPTTSQPPATTAAPALPTGPVSPAVYDDVPSFEGTVTYSQHDLASADPGWQATLSLKFAGPMQFVYTVVEESAGEDEFLFLGGPGTLFLGDGAQTWIDEADDPPAWPIGVDPFRHLFYDSEAPGPVWGDICGASPERIGVATIAGRPTSHIACSTALEDYELWVDEETGVILRMRGPLAVGDFHPRLDRDGVFEFAELTLEPVTIPQPALPEPVAVGEFPPHHMVSTTDYGNGSETVEYWYRDDDTLRWTVIAGTHPEVMVGYFTVVSDGQISRCDPSGYEGDCWTETIEEGGDDPIPLPSDQVPRQLVADHCDDGAQETMAGRTAQHFSCSGVFFDHRGSWVAVEDARAPDREYWYDTVTDLELGHAPAEGPSMQVEFLDVNPMFPQGIFDHDLPELTELDPYVLDDIEGVIPAWSGPLLDGTMFDLEDFRRPPFQPDPVPGTAFVIVYNWFPGCGDICLDGIAEFQALYETYGTTDWNAAGTGDNIQFVSVVEDVVSVAQYTNDRLAITVPTVACYVEEGDHAQIHACVPESPWFFWGNGVPSWTVLDTGGFLVYGVSGPDYDHAQLDALLAQVSGRDDDNGGS